MHLIHLYLADCIDVLCLRIRTIYDYHVKVIRMSRKWVSQYVFHIKLDKVSANGFRQIQIQNSDIQIIVFKKDIKHEQFRAQSILVCVHTSLQVNSHFNTFHSFHSWNYVGSFPCRSQAGYKMVEPSSKKPSPLV